MLMTIYFGCDARNDAVVTYVTLLHCPICIVQRATPPVHLCLQNLSRCSIRYYRLSNANASCLPNMRHCPLDLFLQWFFHACPTTLVCQCIVLARFTMCYVNAINSIDQTQVRLLFLPCYCSLTVYVCIAQKVSACGAPQNNLHSR